MWPHMNMKYPAGHLPGWTPIILLNHGLIIKAMMKAFGKYLEIEHDTDIPYTCYIAESRFIYRGDDNKT